MPIKQHYKAVFSKSEFIMRHETWQHSNDDSDDDNNYNESMKKDYRAFNFITFLFIDQKKYNSLVRKNWPIFKTLRAISFYNHSMDSTIHLTLKKKEKHRAENYSNLEQITFRVLPTLYSPKFKFVTFDTKEDFIEYENLCRSPNNSLLKLFPAVKKYLYKDKIIIVPSCYERFANINKRMGLILKAINNTYNSDAINNYRLEELIRYNINIYNRLWDDKFNSSDNSRDNKLVFNIFDRI